MKGIKITVMMLIICQAVIAQTKTAEEVTANRMERLESKLSLTADQETKISKIVFASATEMLALKSTGNFEREEMRNLKRNERQLINAELTTEQRAALKELKQSDKLQRQQRKNERMEHKQARDAAKATLQAKRLEFDSKLTPDEKSTIEQARAMLPPKVKDKSSLSEEQKAERKKINKEVNQLLKPIIKSHMEELKAIKAEFPPKPKKEGKKGKGHHFSKKFLLMK